MLLIVKRHAVEGRLEFLCAVVLGFVLAVLIRPAPVCLFNADISRRYAVSASGNGAARR